ncbi:MAG: DUF4012 domain-containing protein [Patescibacteria group bacterium]|jgi:hypothetical protein
MIQKNNHRSESNLSHHTEDLFDDAVPLSLRQTHAVPRSPSIHHGKTLPLSPYIIRLSREHAPESDAVADHQLLEDLDLDPELLLEDEERKHSDDLEVDLDDVKAQLQEFELQIQYKVPDVLLQVSTSTSPNRPVAHPSHTPGNSLALALQKTVAEEDPLTLFSEDEHSFFDDVCATLSHYTHSKKRFARTPLRYRAVVIFALLAVVCIAPLQAVYGFASTQETREDVTDIGRLAIDNLMRGASALSTQNFDVATTNFEKASQQFSEAQSSLASVNLLVSTAAAVLPSTSHMIGSARALTDAGTNLSAAASLLADAADTLSSQSSPTLVTKIDVLKNYFTEVLPLVEQAEENFSHVDSDIIPTDYQDEFALLSKTLPTLRASIEEFLSYADTLNTILGQEQKMRYLFIFQNNTELRATGGFMGSFAEIDLLDGALVNIRIPEGGSYDVQGQLSAYVSAPEPLQLLDPRWEFQDANWFPDYPTSAKKILWFYDRSGGPTVDGVISLNASILPQILKITGPIELPAYGKTIDSENVLFETQKIVEDDYVNFAVADETRTVEAPKQFIGDLADAILIHMQNADFEELLAVTSIVANALNQQEIQLYFSENSLESQVLALGWAGAQTHSGGDYLEVVDTNLGGGKTDGVISQNIDLSVDIGDDGSITNTVTITKTHEGLKSALFEGLNNVDYLRIYVPRGAELLSASGFNIPDDSLFETSDLPLTIDEDLRSLMLNARKEKESQTDIWEENGFTVFGNWMQTAPGETQTVTFTYRLPIRLSTPSATPTFFEMAKEKIGFNTYSNYSLTVQKQSGVLDRVTNVVIHAPNSLTSVWESKETTGRAYQFDNQSSKRLDILFEQQLPYGF